MGVLTLAPTFSLSFEVPFAGEYFGPTQCPKGSPSDFRSATSKAYLHVEPSWAYDTDRAKLEVIDLQSEPFKVMHGHRCSPAYV